MKHIILSGIAAAALLVHPAQAKTYTFAPTSKWALSYEEEGCRLVRMFGEGKDRTALVLTRNAPGSGDFSMVLAGKPVGYIQENDDIKVGFGPGVKTIEPQVFRGALGDLRPALVFSWIAIQPSKEGDDESRSNENLPAPNEADTRRAEDGITFMTVTDSSDELRLEFGSMENVHEAMRECTQGLFEAWGLDAEEHANMTRKPVPLNPDVWIKTSDYPRSMVRQGQSAIISVRVLVDVDGRVSECFIQRTTRPKAFDDAVCGNLVKRARFDPALDANGAPMKSYYQTIVRFLIP